MALLVDAHDGLLLLAAEPYDTLIVERIRALPQRHYRRVSRDWRIPARREHLRSVSALVAELDERDVAVEISQAASQRLARASVGRAILRHGAIEIASPYSLRRLPALRALPGRRFDPTRRTWTVPLTRAGALAILDLADRTDELVTSRRARVAMQRAAEGTVSASATARDPDRRSADPTRRSPAAHWRHHTRGPIFDNPAHPRVEVPGIGWCVRIRVTPRHERAGAT